MLEDQVARRLADGFGLRVPAPFVRLVQSALDAATSDGPRDPDLPLSDFATYHDVMFDFAGPVLSLLDQGSARPDPPRSGYDQTPPELLVFGRLGVDGVHFGFVAHAPELDPDDYPLGQLAPMDDAEVGRLGDDTRSGIEFLLSRVLYWRRRSGDAGGSPWRADEERAIAAASEQLGLRPTAAKGGRRLDRIRPRVPTGWRHEPSADGIGVLAPQDAFAPSPPRVARYGEPIEPAAEEATHLLDAGYPATALLGIRESYWRSWTTSGVAAALTPVWARAYQELGRPLLGRALGWRSDPPRRT